VLRLKRWAENRKPKVKRVKDSGYDYLYGSIGWMEIYISLFLIALLCSAFFSGVEMAFISASRLKIEVSSQRKSLSGLILSKFVKRPDQFLGTALVGNNIALVLLSMAMAVSLKTLISPYLPDSLNIELFHLLVQTIVTTTIVLLFGEFIPKALFRINPYATLSLLAIPLQMIYWLLAPVAYIFTFISKRLLQLFGEVKFESNKPVFTRVDLSHFVDQAAQGQEEEEDINKEIFEKALELTNVKVRECMIPRTEVEAVDVDDSVENLKAHFIQTKLSKLLIYEGSIDNVLGYVHHHALLKRPEKIREILIAIKAVPESMPARTLLNHFRNDSKSTAWVVDEFGGTAGIVTLEDILEEIFGEIDDEHDVVEFIERQIAEDEYIFSGRIEIDYLNEKYGFEIPEGEYETLAGYIVSNTENIPVRDESIVLDEFEFNIINVSDKKIETVKLKWGNGK